MKFVRVDDWEEKLIGLGCDGTNVNIAAGGLRGYLEEAVLWIIVFWCLHGSSPRAVTKRCTCKYLLLWLMTC